MLEHLLLSRPCNFEVSYNINPYMQTGVDTVEAVIQWENAVHRLREYTTVETVDYSTETVNGVSGSELPDIVFCANHAMPLATERAFILSNLRNDVRKPETAYFAKWARNNGYSLIELNGAYPFEGAGDAKWSVDGDSLFLGYGQRSSKKAIDEIEQKVDCHVTKLELVSEKYYHLDVGFTILSESDVIIVEEAFTQKGLSKINRQFETVLSVSENELRTLPGNSARVADGVIAIDSSNTETANKIAKEGYQVIMLDMSEFRKAGGSIDCLLLRLPRA